MQLRVLITTQSVQDYQNYVRFMHFARRLVRRGHRVTLVTASPEPTVRPRCEVIDGVQVLVMPGIGPWRLRRGALEPLDVMGRIFHVLRERYDVVHCDGHRPATVSQAIVSRLARGTPWISEWVDLFGAQGIGESRRGPSRHLATVVETHLEERVHLLSDGVIAISRGLFRRALEIGVSPDRLVYIPGGADVERIPVRSVSESRHRLGLDPEALIVGLVGYELADRKDVEPVLEACARLRQQLPTLRLLVTGKSAMDHELVTKLSLADTLLSLGWVPEEEYSFWLSAVNVFALPFRDTMRNVCKWPMKAGDYLAAGRPIVTNPTGDMRHLLSEHDVGLLVQATGDGFFRGLATLLTDAPLANSMGDRARSVAESVLSWDRLTERLEQTYLAVQDGTSWPPDNGDSLRF